MSNWIAFGALTISIVSLIVSWVLWALTHRPYFWVSNFGAHMPNGSYKPMPHIVAYQVTNAPALLVSGKLSWVLERSDGRRDVHEHIPRRMVCYPGGGQQRTYQSKEVADAIRALRDDEVLRRTIELTYSLPSGGTKYTFKLESHLSDDTGRDWHDDQSEESSKWLLPT